MKCICMFLMMIILSGCMNLYVRCPFTDEKIEQTYQCTKETFVFSYVVIFPQVMSPNGPNFVVENFVTIPIGCLFFIDVACETAIDTVSWPIDYMIMNKRK